MRAAVALGLVALLVAGCGPSRQSIPVAPVHGPIPDGQGRVVIARKANLLVAQGVKITVKRDGKEVGEVAPGGFLAWDQPAGKSVLDFEGDALHLSVEAGKPTCVQVLVGTGGLHLSVLDAGNYDQFISTYDPPVKP